MSKKPDTRTTAQRQKAVRQEALREQLAAQGHVQHVVDIIEKIQDVDGENANMESQEFQRLSKAAELRLKLIAKYAPDLKAVEVEDSRNPLEEMTDDERYTEFQRLVEAAQAETNRVTGSGEAGSRKH